jgi:hypothetical protein
MCLSMIFAPHASISCKCCAYSTGFHAPTHSFSAPYDVSARAWCSPTQIAPLSLFVCSSVDLARCVVRREAPKEALRPTSLSAHTGLLDATVLCAARLFAAPLAGIASASSLPKRREAWKCREGERFPSLYGRGVASNTPMPASVPCVSSRRGAGWAEIEVDMGSARGRR